MNKRRTRAVGFALWLSGIACLFLGMGAFEAYASEQVSPEDLQAYKDALQDTETATQAEIFTRLLAVVPGPDRTSQKGCALYAPI